MVINRHALIALRERSGMSQRQLAAAAGISGPSLHAIESGASAPKDATIKNIAKALVVPIPAILENEEVA